MNAVNPDNVMVGRPDQAVTGAISSAPVGSQLPESVDGELPEEAEASGYVNEDGLTLQLESSTTDIRDWSGDLVRRIQEEFDGIVTYTHMELSLAALKDFFGDDNVTEQTSGGEKKVKINSQELPSKARFFRMKDGNRRALLVVPRGQITERGEVEFVRSNAVNLPCTVSCYPDDEGNNAYLYIEGANGSGGDGASSQSFAIQSQGRPGELSGTEIE